MKIPPSMEAELQAWNHGAGIELSQWVGCEGSYSLAVGYTTLFCPTFTKFEDYIFRIDGELDDDFIHRVRGFEAQKNSSPKSIEWVMNHIHLDSLQHSECPDISSDKLIYLGEKMAHLYRAMLHHQFPNDPCVVEFFMPDDPEDIPEYRLSFWQEKHDDQRDP